MLHARLLGVLEVERDGIVVRPPASQRPWALFGYLALAERPVTRAELAAQFWPDVLDQSARASLRSALWALRRRIGDALLVDGERVGLEAGPPEPWIDVREFARLAPTDPAGALALCRGELLEGVEDEWALAARERHRERVIALLEEMAAQAEQRGELGEAIELSRIQTDRDPLDEAAHRRLMTRLEAAGDGAAAIRAYHGLAERLRRELGLVPSAATRELAGALRERAGRSSSETVLVPARSTVGPGQFPVVGREHELGELGRAWATAAAGAGGVALIRGEAGMGKTRVSAELASRAGAGGGRAAASAALDLGGSAPLSLWAELVRELLPALPAPPAEAAWPDDLAVLGAELPPHFGLRRASRLAIAPDLQQTRLFEAVVALLGWAARDAPLLLIIDDAHSADTPSLELAGYAARRLAGLPVLMLITRRALPRRPPADRLEHALRARGLITCELELGPLADERVAALARRSASLSEEDVARVVARAEGNPLLALETARAIGRGEADLAPNLRGSVRAMLDRLGPEARTVAEMLAVAARPISAAELAELPLEDPATAASAALETGLIVSTDGAVGFRHALLRDAAFAEIAEPRRRGLHRRWAHALLAAEAAGALSRAAEVARHLQLGGAVSEAVPELARAAAHARSVAALASAAAFLREALEIAPGRSDLWLELGEVEAWRSRRSEAESAFQAAIARLDDDPLPLARAWLRRARAYHGAICVPRAILESTANAIALLDRTTVPAPEERSEALAARAWAEAVAGSVDAAEQLLAQLSAETSGRNDLRTYDVGHARALVLMRRGRFVDSYAPSIAAGEAVVRAGRPDLAFGCWANAASAAAAAGEPERALEFLDRGQRAIAGHGLQSQEIHLLSARTFVLRGLRRLGEARAAAEAERSAAEQLGAPELVAMAGHDLGLVALEAGDYRRAADLLAAALRDVAPISRPLTRLALAEALARSSDPHGASEQIRATVLEPVRPSDFPDALVPRLARAQALVALAEQRPAEARARIEESIAGWERLLARTVRSESMTAVLADLGRPVVGLVEPERELARARADARTIITAEQGATDAVLP